LPYFGILFTPAGELSLRELLAPPDQEFEQRLPVAMRRGSSLLVRRAGYAAASGSINALMFP